MAKLSSNTIGVVGLGMAITHNEPNFFDEMLRGILQGGGVFDRDIAVVRHSQWAWDDSLPFFTSDRYEGIIILGTALRDRVFEGIELSGLPAVTIGGAHERDDLPSVDVDNYGSACAAVQHLIELGHRRIGYVSGQSIAGWASDRHRAYVDTLTAAGISLDDRLIAPVDVAGVDEGYDAGSRLFSLDPSIRPTAIACVNDDTAYGVLQRLTQIGLRVPLDVSVIGFDDNYHSSVSTPPLSTIRQPKQAIGGKAVELLVSRILSPNAPVFHASIPGELILRASTAAPSSL